MLLLGPLGACGEPAELEIELPAEPEIRTCGDNSAVSASLFGAIKADIEWSENDMECHSMPRPDNHGARLRFVGDVSGERLAIIIALPSLNPGDTAVEIPSNVTVSVEGSGRFFSTPGLESCWTEVITQSELVESSGTFVIEGTLFCIAALGEINGDAAVSIPEFRFSTILNWGGK